MTGWRSELSLSLPEPGPDGLHPARSSRRQSGRHAPSLLPHAAAGSRAWGRAEAMRWAVRAAGGVRGNKFSGGARSARCRRCRARQAVAGSVCVCVCAREGVGGGEGGPVVPGDCIPRVGSGGECAPQAAATAAARWGWGVGAGWEQRGEETAGRAHVGRGGWGAAQGGTHRKQRRARRRSAEAGSRPGARTSQTGAEEVRGLRKRRRLCRLTVSDSHLRFVWWWNLRRRGVSKEGGVHCVEWSGPARTTTRLAGRGGIGARSGATASCSTRTVSKPPLS